MNRNPRTSGELKRGFPGTGGDVRGPVGEPDEPDVQGHKVPGPETLHRRPPVTGGTGEGVAGDDDSLDDSDPTISADHRSRT